MTLGQWLDAAERELTQTGSPDPRTDAEWMAVDVLGVSRSMLGLMLKSALSDQQQVQLDSWLARRAKGEPLQYIEGTAWFMGMEFGVDPRVLIPRPDTETLCEAALELLEGMKNPTVADMCTGSGAIGISVKRLCPKAKVTLTDISRDALFVARTNAMRLGAQVEALQGDLYGAIEGRAFDMLLCNPPYLTQEDMDSLQKEVTFEPALALFGGEDGLDCYRRIADGLNAHLNPGGYVLLEVGMGQDQDVLKLVQNAMDCAETQVLEDMNGVSRVVIAQRAK